MNNDLSNKAFIPFSNACLLFDEAKQSVLVLNQSATFIYCASFEVNSHDDLACLLAEQFSISHQQAQQDIEQFYYNVDKNSFFLEDKTKQNSFLNSIQSPLYPICDNHFKTLYLSVHQNTFSLNVPTQALVNELSAIYSYFMVSSQDSLKNSTLDNIKYKLHICLLADTVPTLFSIYINAQCVAQNLLPDQLIPYVFGIIFETTWRTELNKIENKDFLEDQERSLMFHSAVLAKNNNAVLFPAESGAGKSTLAAVLAYKGWDFFTDELAIIKPKQGSVSPCPLSVCVKEGAVDFLCHYYPQLKNLNLYHRLDNKKVRYLPVLSSQQHKSVDTKITVIIFPFYNKEIYCELNALDKEEALMRFLGCGSSGRPINKNELVSIIQFIEKTPCYSLVYSDINAALKEVESIANSHNNQKLTVIT